MVRADFLELMDKVFDVLNSRSQFTNGYKKSLDPSLFFVFDEVKSELKELLDSLKNPLMGS